MDQHYNRRISEYHKEVRKFFELAKEAMIKYGLIDEVHKVRKREKKKQRETALERAEKVCRYVHINGMALTVAWKKASPFTKAKKPNLCILAKRACERFEREKGRYRKAAC